MFINASEQSLSSKISKTDNVVTWKTDVPSAWELNNKISSYREKFLGWSQAKVDDTVIDVSNIGNIQYDEKSSLLPQSI